MGRKRRKIKAADGAVSVFLALLMAAAVFPLLFCLAASLKSEAGLIRALAPFSWKALLPERGAFRNYLDLFRVYRFAEPVLWTLLVAAVTVAGGCLFCSLAAFALTQFRFPGRGLVLALVMLSFMMPFESIAIPLYETVNALGIRGAFWQLVLPAVPDGLAIFLYVQFFRDVPRQMVEAARVDGASWLMIYARIFLPVCRAATVTAALLLFMGQWNSYLWPLLVARAGGLRTIQIALGEFAGERSVRWTMIYAGTALSAMIPVGLFLPLQRWFVSGVTAGCTKG